MHRVADDHRTPDHVVVSYINCTAGVKALSDIICTSSNAVHLINQIPEDQPIIFAPDRNLGRYLIRETGREMVLIRADRDARAVADAIADFPEVDYVAYARSLGVSAVRVDSQADLEAGKMGIAPVAASEIPEGRGVMYYRSGKVLGAVWQNGQPTQKLFENQQATREAVVVDRNPADKTARRYLEHAARYMVQDVAAEWTGVEAMEGK